MRLLAITDAELELIKRALVELCEKEAFIREVFGDDAAEAKAATINDLAVTIGWRAMQTRCPPTLIHGHEPHTRGPRRAITGRLYHEKGMDALLLECGHLVSRHTRQGPQYTHCEACSACQDIG